VELVRPFVAGWEAAGGVALEQLRAADVTAFVVAHCQDARGGTAPRMVGALRSMLGFLHVEGLIEWPLASVVPPVATWKLAGVPKALDDGQVAALLASCDQDTVVGRRDLAILTVLVRLGLRASEAAALRLDDIDWRGGAVTVHGKGNRHAARRRVARRDRAGAAASPRAHHRDRRQGRKCPRFHAVQHWAGR